MMSEVMVNSTVSPGMYFLTSTLGMEMGWSFSASKTLGRLVRTAMSRVWEASSLASTCFSTTFAGALPLRKPAIFMVPARRARAFRRADSRSVWFNVTVISTEVGFFMDCVFIF